MSRHSIGNRWQALIAAACALALALGVAACGDSDSSTSGSTDGGEGSADAVEVAMVTSGAHTDSSFVQSWWEGSQQAQSELGDAAKIVWNDGLNSLDALDRAAGAALTNGAEALIFTTSEAPQLVTEYAEKFPDAWVCGLEAPREDYLANVCTMLPQYWEGAFLAGALAGLVTETDRVGVVSAFDIPVQNLQVEGFALGARYTNPDVKIERAITESLIDSGKARAATQAQLAAGADVILSAVDEAAQGMYLAARDAGGYVIPQYTDQYESAPDVVLTSVVYHHDEVGATLAKLAVEGELEAKSYEFDLATYGVGELAPFRGATGEAVSEEARKQVAEIQKEIEDGTIIFPGLEELGERGSGESISVASLKGGT